MKTALSQILNVHDWLNSQHLPLVERVELEGERWYRIHGEENPANWYASVTNILSVVQPKPLTEYYKRTSYKKQSEELEQAANLGTHIHEVIDKDLQGEEVTAKDLAFSETVNLGDWFKRWQKLKQEKQITAQALEVPVVNQRYGYAGTLDFIGSYMGEPAIFDIKSGFYSVKAGYQLAAYKQAWSTMVESETGMANGRRLPADVLVGTKNPTKANSHNTSPLLSPIVFHPQTNIKLVGLSLPWNRVANTFVYEHVDFCWNRFLDALGLFRGLNYRRLEKQNWKYLHVERDGN